jgi:hypothetical protein
MAAGQVSLLKHWIVPLFIYYLLYFPPFELSPLYCMDLLSFLVTTTLCILLHPAYNIVVGRKEAAEN